MNARDDLFTIVQNALASTAEWESGPGRAADAIIAAGWVPVATIAAAQGQVEVTRGVLIETEQAHHRTAAERDALADRIADEIKTAGLATAAAADIDDANRAWWYGYGYAIEDAARIARALASPDRTATREEERDG